VNKGIDIQSKSGTAVHAAAPGKVVYAGGNLRGYGKLVIIKHDEHFLSAYGNNRKLKVAEDDQVVQGQIISEVGMTAADIEMLHFEIRRDGKPEDPGKHLPK
jgi:lipoprotein NlpD